MTVWPLLEGLRGGASLVQAFNLGGFKVRVYGSWLDAIVSRSGQTSRGLVSVANGSKGLKDLAPPSVQTAQTSFAAAIAPSIVRSVGASGTASVGSSVVASNLLGQSRAVGFPGIKYVVSTHIRPLSQRATVAQKAFSQQVNSSRQSVLPPNQISSAASKAFAQQGLIRFFSQVTRVSQKVVGEASGETAAKANRSSYPGKRFVEWYIQKIEEKPLLVKSLTAGTIFVASDLCAQALGGWEGGYDFFRSLRMAGFGLCLSGPLLHYWFGLMTRMYPGRDLISVCKKIFIGQTTVGPLFTAVFYSLNAALQGEDADAIWGRLKRDLIPTLKAGLTYWPLIDLFTYSRVPVHLMPLTNNTASFLWTIYITYIAGKSGADDSA